MKKIFLLSLVLLSTACSSDMGSTKPTSSYQNAGSRPNGKMGRDFPCSAVDRRDGSC